MDVEIVRIDDHGDPKSEVVVLKVLRDTNLNGYALCDNTYTSGGTDLSNERRNFYWFPNVQAKKGDHIALWTKHGKRFTRLNTDTKTTWHHFFWCVDTGVWNNTGDLAILLEIKAFQPHVVKKVKQKT